MKIKVIETVTEIEATASEIGASQTVAGKFAALLANALTPYRVYEDEGGEDEDDGSDRQTGGD